MQSLMTAVGALLLCALPQVSWAENAVGVNVHLPTADELDAVEALGAEWIRIDNNWLSVEQRPGQFTWGPLDQVVDGAVARDLKVMMTIAYTPAWASAGDSDGVSGNDAPRAGTFETFVRAVVNRYQDRVQHYGIWNEPNLEHFFEGSREQYLTDVLRPGAAAVKAQCPECLVLGPDLAGLTGWQGWLTPILEDAGDVLDIVTHHTYAAVPGVRPGLWVCDDFLHAIDNETAVCFYKPGLRQVLDQAGWAGDVWLTETGHRGQPWDAPDEQNKQVQTAQGTLELQLARPWWTHTFFYELTDCRPALPECEIDGFGMLRRTSPSDATWADNFVVKPVFEWLRRELAENPAWSDDAPEPPPPPAVQARIEAPKRPAGIPDGDLSDWDDRGCTTISRYVELSAARSGPEDLTARACAAWSDDALWLAVEVVDDRFAEGELAALWMGDSIQLAVDVDADAVAGAGFDDDDVEWTVALFRGVTRVAAEHGIVAANAQVVRDGNRVRYELRAPVAALQAGRTLKASFLVNENDGRGREGWLEWTAGIGTEKRPEAFGEIELVGRAAVPAGDAGPGVEPDAAPPPPLPITPDSGALDARLDVRDVGAETSADTGSSTLVDGEPLADQGTDPGDSGLMAHGQTSDGGCHQTPVAGAWWLAIIGVARRRRLIR